YGGTERVVSYLTEELVRMGHDVTLFASGDSVTSARLEPQCREALRLDAGVTDSMACHTLMAERVMARAGEFDILHSHIDYLLYPLLRGAPPPSLTTLHGRLDLPGLADFYRMFSEIRVAAISDAQRSQLPEAFWQG